MAEKQDATGATSLKAASAGDPSKYGKRLAEDAEQQVEQAARSAETAAGKLAQSGERAIDANSDLLRTNVQTGQEALRAGLQTGMRTFEDMAAAVSRTLGLGNPNPELAEQSARNLQAVSDAGVALARGGQEASRVWLDIAQQGMRSNVDRLSELARCRSFQDVVALQSTLVRENLQRWIDGGQNIARASTSAMEEASRAMQQVQPGSGAPH